MRSLPAAVPSPPGAPEVVASGKDFATVQWLKPESDGGSPLIHYLVERRERKSARWVKVNRDGAHLDTTLKVSGLTEGNIYQFRVTAVNRAGESEASEVSLYVVCRVPTCECKCNLRLLRRVGSLGASLNPPCPLQAPPLPPPSLASLILTPIASAWPGPAHWRRAAQR